MERQYSRRNVKKETLEHYKGGWPVSADARRNLYLKYAGYPEDIATYRGERGNGYISRDMWNEIAKSLTNHIGEGRGLRGIDVGASSGYFIRQLLSEGFKGEIVGVDIETGHQPFLQWRMSQEFPDATVIFGGSDAQSLKNINIVDDDNHTTEVLEIRKNSFDFLTELFVLYHVPDPEKAYWAAHKVVKPGGIAIFSGRGSLNQNHLWNLGAKAAHHFDATIPQSFYNHHSIDDMENFLENSPHFELLDAVSQGNHLWIPATDEGWADYRAALMSLGPLMKKRTGKRSAAST
ncbi:MAG TPA: methyltransferase domain-containing protein [Candidatus Saccharimonadales bacterium]|nr:methyltransferase domain-containing protein [Candidatus Saccharimonadales bacterium]